MSYTLTTERLTLIRAIRALTIRHSIAALQLKPIHELQFMIRLLEDGVDV